MLPKLSTFIGPSIVIGGTLSIVISSHVFNEMTQSKKSSKKND